MAPSVAVQQCPTEVQQCKEVHFCPLQIILLLGFSCSYEIGYEKDYAEMPFKTRQFGGCYKTLQQVVQSFLSCILE